MFKKKLNKMNMIWWLILSLSLGALINYINIKILGISIITLIYTLMYYIIISIVLYKIVLAFQLNIPWRKVEAFGFLGLTLFLGCSVILFKYI